MTRCVSTYLSLECPCRWLRGNHHGHSRVSDGTDEPLTIARAYEAAGYHYFALSEHDILLHPEVLQPHTSMCIVPAIEVTSRFNQTLLYLGAKQELPKAQLTPCEIMARVHSAGGLFIFDHPNWLPFSDYASDALLDGMEGLCGMEIYTGVIERLAGEARATDRWDRLLSKGWRVFGHGTDDQHEPGDYFVAWNQVQWHEGEPVTWRGIVSALAAGRFYASTGSTIQRVGVSCDGQSIVVESDADEVRWITRDGIIAKKERGGTSILTLEELGRTAPRLGYGGRPLTDMRYVRSECLGHGNAMAWSQPFWIVD